MNQSFRNNQFPAGNPIANALVVIVGVVAIGLAFVLGVAAFIALAAIGLVLGAIIAIRVWWFNRKHGGNRPDGGQRPGPPHSPEVIEGEFHVIREERQRERQ